MNPNSFNLTSSLEHISSLAKRAESYINIEVMTTGIIRVKYWVGKKKHEEVLSENSNIVIVPPRRVQEILSTLEGLSDQERWFLLRALEQYPKQDPDPHPALYRSEDSEVLGYDWLLASQP